jgi:hypothetical protein
MNELPKIEHWIKTTLSADQALAEVIEGRIFAYQAPEKAGYPHIIFSLHTAANADVRVTGRTRAMTGPTYTIKVVCRDSPTDQVRTAADRIDDIIGVAVNLTDLGLNFSSYREEPISYATNDGALKFHHLGGVYRIIAYT